MKTIELKTVQVEIDGQPVRLSYKAQLIEVMRHPADGKSADLDEVRRSLRVLDALEKSDQALELEDADFEYLKYRIENARWPVIDRYVMKFVEDVTTPTVTS